MLVALALGVDNLAVSIGIGVSGVRGAVRVRVAVVFGLFEAGMPLLGMALGRTAAAHLGDAAQWLGGGLLFAVGCYQVIGWLRERRRPHASDAGEPTVLGGWVAAGRWGTGRLLVSGLALSIDNLVVGFALGAYHVSLEVAALVIGVVSVAMSLAGLELGAKLGAAFGERGELAGGIVLAGVGIAIAAGLLLPVRLGLRVRVAIARRLAHGASRRDGCGRPHGPPSRTRRPPCRRATRVTDVTQVSYVTIWDGRHDFHRICRCA
jgi:manganese efflux pump family protein